MRTRRPNRPYTEEDILAIVKLYREGVSLSEIGRIYNRPRQSIGHQIDLVRYKYNLGYRYKAYETKSVSYELPKPNWALVVPWTKSNSSRYYFPK